MMGELGRRTPSGTLDELEAITASPRGEASLEMAGGEEPTAESLLSRNTVLFAVAPTEIGEDSAAAHQRTDPPAMAGAHGAAGSGAEASAADGLQGETASPSTLSRVNREDTMARKKNKRMTVSAIIAGSFINDEVGDTSSDEEHDPEEPPEKIGWEMLILPVMHFSWYIAILAISAHLLNLWLKIFQGASGVEERLEHLVSATARGPQWDGSASRSHARGCASRVCAKAGAPS